MDINKGDIVTVNLPDDKVSNTYIFKRCIGLLDDGIAQLRFPSGSQGRLLFWKVIEASRGARFNFYGFTVDLDLLPEE